MQVLLGRQRSLLGTARRESIVVHPHITAASNRCTEPRFGRRFSHIARRHGEALVEQGDHLRGRESRSSPASDEADHDAIGHGHGLDLVVRDVDRGGGPDTRRGRALVRSDLWRRARRRENPSHHGHAQRPLLKIASPAFPCTCLEIIAVDPKADARQRGGSRRWFDLDGAALQAALAGRRPGMVCPYGVRIRSSHNFCNPDLGARADTQTSTLIGGNMSRRMTWPRLAVPIGLPVAITARTAVQQSGGTGGDGLLSCFAVI